MKVLRRKLESPLDAHELILRGLPGASLSHLLQKLAVITPDAALERAIGMSLRTMQRRKRAATKPLSTEQSGRTWKFAEILAEATEVLGSQEAAERWLEKPAIGLDRHRPIDLLATPAGVEMVETYLGRMAYDVYT
jgi:putative toxin-antitoxin system antitoxin component (TIGR02293 family)